MWLLFMHIYTFMYPVHSLVGFNHRHHNNKALAECGNKNNFILIYYIFFYLPILTSVFPRFIHSTDDTYMYDDAARGALGRPHQGHWYDEPPYESDPDDFLMSGMNLGPAATIQVSSDRHSRFHFIFCT